VIGAGPYTGRQSEKACIMRRDAVENGFVKTLIFSNDVTFSGKMDTMYLGNGATTCTDTEPA
jgi:hypothetical protein